MEAIRNSCRNFDRALQLHALSVDHAQLRDALLHVVHQGEQRAATLGIGDAWGEADVVANEAALANGPARRGPRGAARLAVAQVVGGDGAGPEVVAEEAGEWRDLVLADGPALLDAGLVGARPGQGARQPDTPRVHATEVAERRLASILQTEPATLQDHATAHIERPAVQRGGVALERPAVRAAPLLCVLGVREAQAQGGILPEGVHNDPVWIFWVVVRINDMEVHARFCLDPDNIAASVAIQDPEAAGRRIVEVERLRSEHHFGNPEAKRPIVQHHSRRRDGEIVAKRRLLEAHLPAPDHCSVLAHNDDLHPALQHVVRNGDEFTGDGVNLAMRAGVVLPKVATVQRPIECAEAAGLQRWEGQLVCTPSFPSGQQLACMHGAPIVGGIARHNHPIRRVGSALAARKLVPQMFEKQRELRQHISHACEQRLPDFQLPRQTARAHVATIVPGSRA
mmetsp:Transcript_98362/g.317144  ORF Transcript_98362/g.317144 Transcript_98362/m.317144 type:complete len:454 (+) Transcript_98362:114-1475(+)